ncbi:MAG: hypothetical protein QGM45_11455 [Anaerolineales bacterium]|nr:hypothetical protein [Anaerolineales bacterium]
MRFPKVFSFIEDPDTALDVLEDLAAKCASPDVANLFWDQSRSTHTDHGAASVAHALVLEVRGEVVLRGQYPRAADQREIIMSTGLPRIVGAVPGLLSDRFTSFELRHGRSESAKAKQSDSHEEMAEAVARHLDQCVGRYGVRLKNRSWKRIFCIVAEVLGNAVEHSDRPDWFVSAYLRQNEDEPSGVYYLTIFNFGKSISTTLQEGLPPGSFLRRRIEKAVELHRRRGFFRPWFRPEDLWMLYALQEGVSKLQTNPDGLDRIKGNGTVELITFFQDLCEPGGDHSVARMCIVSGRTRILFTNRFKMRRTRVGTGEQLQIIAFNDDNDLLKPPEKASVARLKKSFPGTIISLRFPLDAEHLRRSEETENEND